MPRRHNSRPVVQPGRTYSSWVGDGKANCSLLAPLPSGSTPAGVTWQITSGRFALVVPQDAAESLATLDLTGDTADFRAPIDQSVVEALVIALCVIMRQERNP